MFLHTLLGAALLLGTFAEAADLHNLCVATTNNNAGWCDTIIDADLHNLCVATTNNNAGWCDTIRN
jgi:hypothetical protein